MASRLRPSRRRDPRAPTAVVRAGNNARRRVLDALWPVAQSALAATLAWYVAHTVLGHPQPFFAPIAAAVSLSTSPIQRSRRIAQMVVGVLLGIAVAEILRGPFGDSTLALGAIVLLTMAVALAAGVSFFGDGMMFPNQAAGSAILVVTLHRHGTGAERGLDAIIGGATAYLIGVLVFPAQPLTLLDTAERRVLEILARRLGVAAGQLRAARLPEPDWTLAAGHEIHQGLSALARARATARLNVRVAPRRFTQRRAVDAENRRTAQLDLLANAVISLIRSVTPRAGADTLPNSDLIGEITVMSGALRRLADSDRPWPETVMRETEAVARTALAQADARGVDRDHVTAAILRTVASDLISVIEPPRA